MKLAKLIILFVGILTMSLTACTFTNFDPANQMNSSELTQTFTQSPPTAPPMVPHTNVANSNSATENAQANNSQSSEVFTTNNTCILHSDWTHYYTVQQGDTLAAIARRANTTVRILADGNCLENANNLRVGQILRLPNGIAATEAEITINGLWQNSDLQVTNNQVSIGGYATGLPLGAPVRVQLLNANNTIITEQVTNTQDTNVGSGGVGDFYVTLQVGNVLNQPNATAEGAPAILRIYGYDQQNNVLVDVTRNIFLRIHSTTNAPIPVVPTANQNPISQTLTFSPYITQANTGHIVLDPNTSVTVRWENPPQGATINYLLHDFFSDGGPIQIGQGTSASFITPERFEGIFEAIATSAQGTEIARISQLAISSNLVTSECYYIPPVLGPGVTLYADASFNSAEIGNVGEVDYIVIASQLGQDNDGNSLRFYQIKHPDTGETGWVGSNRGENLSGNCLALR